VLEASADNPTYQELVDAINGLSDLERIELLALTWLGRGDYAKEEWREVLEEARRIHDEKETDYLIGTPLLADYLEEGLSQLGYSLEDFEIGRM
jgi:pyruvate-formate lyase-activating enzyme